MRNGMKMATVSYTLTKETKRPIIPPAHLIEAAPDMFEALEGIATGMWHTRACAALIEPESEEPCYCDQEIAKPP